MKAWPPGLSTRAISIMDTQKKGMCSNAWPDSTTSALRDFAGIR